VKAWVNGILTDFNEVKVHLLSHSFSRASAVFEVMEIVNTPQGPAFFCLNEHVERFFTSAEATFMKLKITPDELKAALMHTAAANHVECGVAKIFAYYPDITLGTLPASPTIDVAVFCLGYQDMGIAQEDLGLPVTAGISTFRKLDPHTAAVHAKVVGNYVNGFLAKSEVRALGYDEAILLDTHGYIAEGPTSNIFFVRGNTIVTPTTESVLPGITRAILIRVLNDMDYTVNETHILPEDLVHFEEAFFSGTLNHVQPIRALADRALVCPGPITSTVRQRMLSVLAGHEPDFQAYLSLVA
jgi:branched-chain amino acid aminotransferase